MKAAYILLSFSLLGSAAHAATIVQTQNFSFTPTSSQVLTFLKFETAGGNHVLNSVTITTSLTKSGGSLYVDNDSPTSASGSITQSVTISLSSNDVDLLKSPSGSISSITATSSYFVTVGADDGDGNGYQAGTIDWGGTEFADKTESLTETIRNVAEESFIGSGSYAITASGLQGTDTAAVSGASGAFSPASASGYVTVTYDYTDLTPVPEPGSWLIVCGGLGAGLFVRRRRA